jgi:hypothetical protein
VDSLPVRRMTMDATVVRTAMVCHRIRCVGSHERFPWASLRPGLWYFPCGAWE